ncbi:AOCX protein, partial [Polyodon spathula]|nr:retina-specific copper amine oxidase [Polyodon spathula]MBN3287803.1 AOCX protein [Polyodon spathula]
MNFIATFVLGLFIFASVLFNIISICMMVRRTPEMPNCAEESHQKMEDKRHDNTSLVFADLTKEEYFQVQEYMRKQTSMNLSHSEYATPSENFIFLIELQLPKKKDVLQYLSGKGKKPERQAKVVVFFGSEGKIKEFLVGLLPNPNHHEDVTLKKYKKYPLITARPVTLGEYVLLFNFIYNHEFKKATKVLEESFGSDGKTLTPFEGMPRGFKSGDRQSWIAFFRSVSGYYLHPVGLEVLVDHSSSNSSNWSVKKVLYNGQYFDSMEHLNDEYEKDKIKKSIYKENLDYASLKPRKKPSGIAPLQYEVHGKRYSIQNNQVLYLDWSFAFGLSSLTGLRVFDVRFKGERIIYELSVQEATSVYGCNTATAMLTKFLDSSFGIGRFAHELVRGVDCPYLATFVDTYRYIDTNSTQRFRNSICIFEHNTGRPLRRHFTDFTENSYGGMANSALVLRTITAIVNYDYVWDFMFYQNGAVETKVYATGYILTAYMTEGGLQYGHQVAEKTLGAIHTHFLNFKVDLDILGVKNIFLTKDMTFDTQQVPWKPEERVKIPKLVEKQLKTEKQAALRFDEKIPRYLHVASNETNKWGHHRSYRIQVVSFNGDPLPEDIPEEKAMSWARYKVAITKHKEEEETSSSLYSQNDIWSPVVNFSEYIEDDESIENEDLVAWVTTGFLHIPHAEDIPNTVTVGNGGGFFLRPHNYFSEDPSIDSPDSVYLHPELPTDSCENNRMACYNKEVCAPHLPPFSYNGFEEVNQLQTAYVNKSAVGTGFIRLL